MLALLGLVSSAAAADGITLTQTLLPAGAAGGEFFGGSLDVDGPRLVVGAPTAGATPGGSGAAYVFEFDGERWVQTARLTPSDPVARDRFGSFVAVSGDIIAVAARRQRVDQRRRGAVYVFEFLSGNWVEVRKLISEVPAGRERPFGQLVLLEGERLVVGSSQGVTTYRRNDLAWSLESSLPTSAVDLRRRVLTTVGGSSSGFDITLLRRRAGAWVEKDTLSPPEDECYWSHAISRAGGRMAVSDPTDTSCPEGGPGKVHLYRRSGRRWVEESQIQPTIPSSFGVDVGFFGFSVALGKRFLLVKAFDLTLPFHTATVYVFERLGSRWVEQLKLGTREGEDEFGRTLLVGNGHFGDDYFFVSAASEAPGKVLVFKSDG